MNLIIVDDEPLVREGIVDVINRIFPKFNILQECETVSEAIKAVKKHQPDLVLLDINLPDGNGFDFLEQTSEQGFNVIFITAYQEFALQALKVGAIDYLLKPINEDELQTAILKIHPIKRPNLSKRTKISKAALSKEKISKIVLCLQDYYQIVHIEDVLYCESDKGYTTFHMEDGTKYVASKTLKNFEMLLPSDQFVRTHQSYIVNFKVVLQYHRDGYLVLKNKSTIPVSSRKKDEIINLLHTI